MDEMEDADFEEKMNAFNEVRIGTTDYVTMFGVVAVCTLVGLYHSRKKKKTTEEKNDFEDYMLANRKMGMLPAALSILATKLSGISMVGGVGEEYTFGPQLSLLFFGYFCGQFIIAFCLIPVFRRAKYLSIYEYLEHRFNRPVRMMFSGFYVFGHLIYIGIVLYVPAISITAVSGLPFEATVLITGVTCTIYCVLGGFKAVVWTDVIQVVVMFICFVLVIIQGTLFGDSPTVIWKKGLDSGFLTAFTFVESNVHRYSAWAIFASGLYTSLRDLGVSQAGVQRLLSVKTEQDAKKSTIVSGVLAMMFMVLLFITSIIIYVNFHKCDPILRKNITGVENADQIFVYSIVTFMNHIPGLSGIALAGILCGAVSSFSSFINAFAATTLHDHLLIWCPSLFTSDQSKLRASKFLTAGYGIVSILLTFAVPYLGGVVKTTFATVSVLTGPLCGILLLGCFHKRYTSKACLISLIGSTAVCVALAIAFGFQRISFLTLPFSTEQCLNRDLNNTSIMYYDPIAKEEELKAKNPFVLSFMWFGPIGIILCVLIGLGCSYLFDPEDVDPVLLHPLVTSNSTYELVNFKILQKNNEDSNECVPEKKERTSKDDITV